MIHDYIETYFIYYKMSIKHQTFLENRTHLRGKREKEAAPAAGRDSVSSPDRCYTEYLHSMSSEHQPQTPEYLIHYSHR